MSISYVPPHAVTYHKAGERADGLLPGDFILVRGKSFYSRLISVGQWFAYPRGGVRFYTHAALVYYDWSMENPGVVEANWDGVSPSPLSKYDDHDYAAVRLLDADSRDISQMMRFADAVMGAKTGYDYLTILSLAVALPTGGKVYFGRAGTSICSQFVAQALYRVGYISLKPPNEVMPADLAYDFRVEAMR